MPRPGKGEVLLRVHACGVCYHDVINRRGNLPRTHVPAILGHEAAGEVVEVGPDTPGWKVGDRAATLQRLSCGECALCESGRNSLCKTDNRFFGEELPGGYAQFMVAPVRGLGRVPSGMPWAVAATVCCTAGTAVHTRADARRGCSAGETVLITGASGGVGLPAVQLAKAGWGARHRRHLGRGQGRGAEGGGRARGHRLARAGLRVRGAQAHGGRGRERGDGDRRQRDLRRRRSSRMAPGGRVVVVGNLETGTVDLNPGLVIVKELEILGRLRDDPRGAGRGAAAHGRGEDALLRLRGAAAGGGRAARTSGWRTARWRAGWC